MRIAVFGAGGVGGYFGWRLAQAGEEVSFIACGEHLRAIQASGLKVSDGAGSGFLVHPAQATGVATPVHSFIYASLLPREWRVRGQLQWAGSE